MEEIHEDIIDSTRYQIIRKIAEGGMGSVYEALQYGSEGFHKTVAIKTILEDFWSDREYVEMFIGEAKLVSNLVHGGIVQIYQLGKWKKHYYIAMEYIEGINLEQFINKHVDLGVQIPVDLAAYIVSRVARALEYAHNRRDGDGRLLGVVHRDVSPKNIMINKEGFVKITDFGIAKALHYMKNKEGEVLMGKAQYMSPEQAKFLETDHRSDIYSLGVVLWQLLANGRTLFDGEDTASTMANVISMEIPPIRSANPAVPPDLGEIVGRALERNLDKRYQTAGMMAYDMEYFLYHDKFGPDYVALERYIKELFPELDVDKINSFTRVYHGVARDRHSKLIEKQPGR